MFPKELINLIQEVLVSVLILSPLPMKVQSILWRYDPRKECVSISSSVGMSTGTSRGAFAELDCLYGKDFTVILKGTSST